MSRAKKVAFGEAYGASPETIERAMGTPKNYTELRADLMALADKVNGMRMELIEVQKLMNSGIAMLVGAADKVFAAAADERASDGAAPKALTYKTKDPSPAEVAAYDKHGTTAAVVTPRVKGEDEDAAPVLKGKRACSICRKPGHRSTTCPDAPVPQRRKK